jgi:xanthine dehydrogenase molybdopterin-binding subunit B
VFASYTQSPVNVVCIFAADECDQLIAAAEPRMQRSGVVETKQNGTGEGQKEAQATTTAAAAAAAAACHDDACGMP